MMMMMMPASSAEPITVAEESAFVYMRGHGGCEENSIHALFSRYADDVVEEYTQEHAKEYVPRPKHGIREGFMDVVIKQ